jgi:hypothetical protein
MPTGCNIATQTAHLYVVRFWLQLLCHMSNVTATYKKINKT